MTTSEIANEASVDVSSVRRFERGRAWPRDPDRLVRAYARGAGVHPRDLWCDAALRWRPNGR